MEEEEEDIRKIENFLDILKKNTSTESHANINIVNDARKYYKVHTFSDEKTFKKRLENLQMSLNRNEECQRLLSSLEVSLTFLLEECMKEQKIVKENIESCKARKAEDKVPHSRSRTIRKTCASPYFKDLYGFPSQKNEDTDRRENLGYLNPWNVLNTYAWTNGQKRALEKGIRAIEIEESKKAEPETIIDIINIEDDSSIQEKSLEELVGSKEKNYDWIKLSVIDLRGARSPLECCAMWYNYLHPVINKKRWSETEGETLKKLVKQYQYQDWESIAHCLGSERSAYQCIGHFKIRLADFSKVKWTEKEMSDITKYVEQFKLFYIPWCKIAWLMDGRYSYDIHKKWMNTCGELKKGKFSLQEDILLAAGLKEFGTDWRQIAEYFPNRNTNQLRARVLVLKGHQHQFQTWTSYEDDLLKNLVQKYGFGCWTKISSHFLYRTSSQMRVRYKSLVRWKKRTGSDTLPMPSNHHSTKAKEEHGLDVLWERAKGIVKDKKVKRSSGHNVSQNIDDNCDEKLMRELYQILKPRKKPGRKKGDKNAPVYHKEFYDIFHVAYIQRGGRGKEVCAERTIPGIAYNILLALQVLDAKITLPSEIKSVLKDSNMLEMDKPILVYLINKKYLIQDKCTFIQFDDSVNLNDNTLDSNTTLQSPVEKLETENDFFPICSPCATTLIGFRTMLLNRVNVKAQSKGYNVQDIHSNSTSLNPTHSSANTNNKYMNSCKLWNRRIGVLFTWAAILSKYYPSDNVVTDVTKFSDSLTSKKPANKKKGRSRKKRKMNNSAEDIEKGGNSDPIKQERQKRAYVKSGKYSLKKPFSDCVRRSSRHANLE